MEKIRTIGPDIAKNVFQGRGGGGSGAGGFWHGAKPCTGP
jgi:hypothetical protein